jgi:hypothetical protein
MQWEPWLTKLLTQYYITGRLNIPDACQGSDLLLLLEYFGILYAPDQLVFASYAAYQRVRAWSDYLTQRSVLAEHVVSLLHAAPIGQAIQLGTVQSASETVCHVLPQGRSDPTRIYAWGNDVDDAVPFPHVPQEDLPSSRVIYNLFNMTKENKVAEALRDDFSVYLQNLVPASVTDVTFAVKMVQIKPDGSTESFRGKRAILKLAVQQRGYNSAGAGIAKSELSFPMDEVTANLQLSVYGSQVGQSRSRFSGRPSLPPAAEHVYRELEEGAPPATEKKPSENVVHQRSIDPVMAGKSDDWKAPVAVVDPYNDGATIASALTGPFASTDDVGEDDARAEAIRQEWVQGSLLNKDIDDRMKELLQNDLDPPKSKKGARANGALDKEKTREPGTPETTVSDDSDPPAVTQSPSVDRGCQPWEWMNLVCTEFFEPSKKAKSTNHESTDGVSAVNAESANKPSESSSPPTSTPQPLFVVKALAEPEAKLTSVKSQEEEISKTREKITTHEGVKERLAELASLAEMAEMNESAALPAPFQMHSVEQSREIPKTPPRGITEAVQTSCANESETREASPKVKANCRHASPSRKSGFFRGRQLKIVRMPQMKGFTDSSSTDAVASSKKDKKSTGLRKLFRR